MAILITGGAGFIGSHLTERLLSETEEILCIDNFNDFYDPAIKRCNVARFIDNDNYKLLEGDIRNKEWINEVFQKHSIKSVVHLAARAGVRPSLTEPYLYEDVNVFGTLNILEACKDHNVDKMIFGSSSSVYGINSKVPFSEEDPLQKPISPYATTKITGEMLCHTYHHLYGIRIVALRFFTVYGPRQRPEMAIHKFTRAVNMGKEIPMYGDGTSRRDYTFIDDIINGIVASLRSSLKYEVLNLGESDTIQLIDLIDLIQKNMGKKAKIKKYSLQPGDVPITYASIEKAKKLIGYSPKVSIQEGIFRFCQWYKTECGN
ncbi:MAG: GDP-mannose 4,6-dehydratase [Candidatus Theseobacter exili]|nr:GDP-mannose 4,6-dehydratase [Candidatus Theseobacter exili]